MSTSLIFNYLETDELLRTPLSIQLNDSCELVKVFYKTTAKSEALIVYPPIKLLVKLSIYVYPRSIYIYQIVDSY